MNRILQFILVFVLGASNVFSQNCDMDDVEQFVKMQEKVDNNENNAIHVIPKQPGHYTAEDWAVVIDSTWTDVFTPNDKLKLFDEAWSTLNAEFAVFQGLKLNWDSLRVEYRPIVADTLHPISRGRFTAIMNHLGLSLHESHTWIEDKLVNQQTALEPGVPLFVTGAYADNSHFGATLTPLSDSTLLVLKTIPNHPIGLEPGDLVLGYDGIPWKILYKELLKAQLPHYRPYMWGTTKAAMTHQFLMSAGMNWHLFDTIDIVKYQGVDTLHLSTSLLNVEMGFIWGNEQLPINGVPWPNIRSERVFAWESITRMRDYISWGIIDGTKIGYIYAISWFSEGQAPASHVATEFKNAVDSLMNYFETDGLIIDQRLNYGGGLEFNGGLELLFSTTITNFEDYDRCGNANDHFSLCKSTFGTCAFHTIHANTSSYYDKPIAVLSGPGAVSGGDLFPLIMTLHPQTRIFGKSTAGAYSRVNFENMQNSWRWEIGKTVSNLQWCDDYKNFLARSESPVDEKVWFDQNSVALEIDPVVEAAKNWIYLTTNNKRTSSSKFTIYPNPTTNFLTIEGSEISLCYIKVMHLNGQEVLVKTMDGERKVLDVSALRAGMYFITIQSKDYMKTEKFIKR